MDIGIPNSSSPATNPDSGLASLAAVAAFFRISCDPADLSRELALATSATRDDILRAAKRVGLKAKSVNEKRFSAGKVLPTPCIAALSDGSFAVPDEGKLHPSATRFLGHIRIPAPLRVCLVPAVALALPKCAGPRLYCVAVPAILRAYHPSIFSGCCRQGVGTSKLFDIDGTDRRACRDRSF